MNSFICLDCKIDTDEINEYYMIQHTLWENHVKSDGMLCISCLEKRLGRSLVRNDFLDCPLNDFIRKGFWLASDRLKDRLIRNTI